MEALLQQISDWLKGMLVDGIMNNLSGMFDAVNQQVADVATQVGQTPANFSPAVFGLVRNISETVIIPIAGMFLTFLLFLLNHLQLVHHRRRAELPPLPLSLFACFEYHRVRIWRKQGFRG